MRISITLPNANHDGESLEYFTNELKRRFCVDFGGCTSYQALGHWIDPRSKEVYNDEVSVVETYTSSLTTRQARTYLEKRAKFLLANTDQHCIMATVDSKALFFDRD